MKIHVLIKYQYGRRVFYPKCVNADLFAAIAGTQTLTENTLKLIRTLGYVIEFMHEEVELSNDLL